MDEKQEELYGQIEPKVEEDKGLMGLTDHQFADFKIDLWRINGPHDFLKLSSVKDTFSAKAYLGNLKRNYVQEPRS